MVEAQRYHLIRTIAGGGMAQVYEAKLLGAAGFERRVAIKRILPEFADDASMRRMFLDEARLASRLHHGNIVQVLDFGVVDGSQFIAMEYVDGIDTARALRAAGGRMLLGVALHLISETAHALSYAHGQRDEDGQPLGIVHRDVSPQNILVSWQGDVKLGDFGIALARGRQEQTRTGVVKGKERYMAPEQARAEKVNGAADVYALGVTLQALAAGTKSLSSAIGEPLSIDKSLPPPVQALIERCTLQDPPRRPSAASVAEAAGALARELLSRDARGVLASWLDPLRDSFSRTSKLDDVMGLSLVALQPHVFTISQATSTDPEDTVDALGSTQIGGRRPPKSESELTTQRRDPTTEPSALAEPVIERQRAPEAEGKWAPIRWLVPIAGLGAVALGAWVVFAITGSQQTAAVAPAPRDASPRLAVAQLRPQPAVPVDRAPDAGPRPDTSAPEPATARQPARRRPRRPPNERPPPSPVEGFGWIRVGGAELIGGQVLLDGGRIGFAPLERRVPAGNHRVVVREPDSGNTLLEQPIDVAPHHTRRKPLRLIR